MPTWVSIRNNRGAWDGVNVDALIRAFTTYGPILEMEVFDRGYRASMLFSNHANALAFVEEMTFSPHGPLFIPNMPYGKRLGAWIPNRRERARGRARGRGRGGARGEDGGGARGGDGGGEREERERSRSPLGRAEGDVGGPAQ